jgi:hypothetical protein
MPSTLVRGFLVLLAALAVVWSVLSYRAVGADEEARKLATRAVFGNASGARIEAALDDLRAAARYTAGNEPLIEEGVLLYAVGRRGEAAEIARRATADEPDNLEAWFLAYSAASDERSRSAAKREVNRLNPWAGDRLP